MALQWVFLPIILLRVMAAASQALSGCQDSCGNVSIPYPFGMSEDCYFDETFLITCNHSFHPPKPFLGDQESNIGIIDISVDGELRVWVYWASDCYNEKGNHSYNGSYDSQITLSTFTFSNTRNKFTAIGCDTQAYIQGSTEQSYTSGCVSLCDSKDSLINGSCSGIGCCQTLIPEGVWTYNVTVSSYKNHTGIWDFNPCSYAFLVEEKSYNFSSLDFVNIKNTDSFPVVLDWTIGNQTCEDARNHPNNFACHEEQNSECYDSGINGPGYRCKCSTGFQGNPYLPNGCLDVDECKDSSLHNCEKDYYCINTNGSYNCSCPEGYHGDGRKGRLGCIPDPTHENDERFLLIKVTAGIGITILVLVVGCSWLYWGIRKRNLIKLKEKFFQQNGGLMLKQQLSKESKREGSVETAKIFTIEELKKATNDFDESRIIGRGGFGTVYKGTLQNKRIVAIKRSKVIDQGQIEQFVNEVIVLSQINHRNVVKLLGCCLETQVPLLVYEFITNGTLFHHIHEVAHESRISWEVRLRVAIETAGALAYLHSAASTPIIHRDVKSTNILLDDNYTAKVSDFGASRLIPLDKTQLTTLVQGTLGYLDPEYLHSSQLTEKSDVYSFGVLLAELLTGKMALSFARPEKDRNLATYFISSMKENRLSHVLEDRVLNEGNAEQVQEVANLAQCCLRLKGEERPTMKEVAMELEGLRRYEKHPWVGVELNLEESEHLLAEPLNLCSTSASATSGFDSLRNQAILSINHGR